MKLVITSEDIKKSLLYDKETGVFTWAETRSNRAKSGSVAGCKTKFGYIMIRINDHLYMAHRLAWIYVYGYWPENFIDHINRNREDNRIANLREATKAQNCQNISIPRHNSSGSIGVQKHYGRWRASLEINGVRHRSATFKTKEEALACRENMKKQFHTFA